MLAQAKPPQKHRQQIMKKSIKQRLLDHLEHEDGTINDCDVDALYREAHHIPDEERNRSGNRGSLGGGVSPFMNLQDKT